MKTHIEIQALIEAKRTELGLRPTQGLDNNRGLKKAVAEALSTDLAPCEIEFLGLNNPKVRLYDEDWVGVFAHLVIGQVLPADIVAKIEANKVFVLGARSTPDGWGKLKFPVVDAPVGDDEVVYVGDADGYEEDGLTWLCPHALALQTVAETNPGASQLLALVLLLGFVPNENKTRWVLANGWSEDHVLDVSKKAVAINAKVFKPRVYMAGAISGDPTTGTPAYKAAFWALVYALSGGSEQSQSGRLRHLQEAFVEKTSGPVVDGLVKLKYHGTLGDLVVFRNWAGAICVANADAALAEAGYVSGLTDVINVIETKDMVWSCDNQGAKLIVAEGSQACGLAAGDDPESNVALQGIDKDTKFAQRVASLMVKAHTNTELVVVDASHFVGFDPRY